MTAKRTRSFNGSRTPALVVPNGPASATTAAAPGGAGRAGSGRKGKFNANGEHVTDPRNGKQVWCASEAEAERFRQLLEMEEKGLIAGLETQPRYPLFVNNVRICEYRADFRYQVTDRTDPVGARIEDVKGMLTPEFRLKHKLFDALNPVKLSIIVKKGKAKHSAHPDQPRSSAGWMDLHWKMRIPEIA